MICWFNKKAKKTNTLNIESSVSPVLFVAVKYNVIFTKDDSNNNSVFQSVFFISRSFSMGSAKNVWELLLLKQSWFTLWTDLLWLINPPCSGGGFHPVYLELLHAACDGKGRALLLHVLHLLLGDLLCFLLQHGLTNLQQQVLRGGGQWKMTLGGFVADH